MGRGRDAREIALPLPEGAWGVASVIVARPGATTVDLNVLAFQPLRGRVEYWKAGSAEVRTSEERAFAAGAPAVVRLSGLAPDTAYGYRLAFAREGAGEMTAGPEWAFQTQRASGKPFVFEVQGDSHPERPHQNDPSLYARTLRAASADRPDLYFTIGDDFSVDNLRDVTPNAVDAIYLGQRRTLGLVGHSAPLFLVNGNHEQAALCNLDGTPESVAVLAQNRREKYFSQPAPEGIYTGNTEPVPHVGLLRNYYAFTWGDALFVVIDPYWHTPEPVDNVRGTREKGTRDLWAVTLGKRQYDWLRETLSKSTAPFKFVFAHHVHGTGRGGVELAGLYEWGGRNRDGSWGFDAKRPGWELPIHPLMAKHGVTVFFQGHDHLFCRQELDGVVYQTLPLPADPSSTLYNREAYRSGDALPGAGRIRVRVSPGKAVVEYVRSRLPTDGTPEHPDGEVAFSYAVAPRRPGGGEKPGGEPRQPGAFFTEVPQVRGNVILGRPTDRSVTLSVLLRAGGSVRVAHGPQGSGLKLRTAAVPLAAGEPREIVLDGLEPNAAWEYRVLDATTGEPLFPETGTGSFHTCRAPGSPFTFTVQADSHLDGNTDPALYAACLANALADRPDFHVDLGDTFMTGKHESRESAARQYVAQRYDLGLVGHSAPLFLVVGNHDGEETKNPGADGADGLAAWSCAQRKRFFPNPVPDAFYGGNPEARPGVGLPGDYYAFTWGDALFVVLDPYPTSRPTRGGTEPWNMTLGKSQYDWLARTLRASGAKYRFVFIHQLTGGLGKGGRGGAEAAPLYEWGGHEPDGRDTFAAHRPGWERPIHALLVENRVTVVFHGHDHFYARQELDGIVYQLVPQPARRNADRIDAEEYGYRQGVLLPGSGHLRVSVGEDRVVVDYVRSALGQGERGAATANGSVAYSWAIPARSR